MKPIVFKLDAAKHAADPLRCVTVKGRSISARLDEMNHSPTGFSWGYGGSGPAQLAYAMLRRVGLSPACAALAYQRLKWQLLAPLDPMKSYRIAMVNEREWEVSDAEG